jgi:Tfp pilus assembly protein PilF
MLRAAEANFESGNPVEAIHKGRMALKVGGGLRVHLALAKYYQSLRLYQEALEHYRAALAVEPGNGVAQTGIKVVERQLPR